MKRIKPSNGHAIETACLDYTLGADCSVYKPELIEHLAEKARKRLREETARANGYKTWFEYRTAQDKDFMLVIGGEE